MPAVEAPASLLESVTLEDEPEDEAEAEVRISKEEDGAAKAIDAGIGDEALVDEMLEIARRHGRFAAVHQNRVILISDQPF
jgi:hypothetical protein